MEGAGSGSLVDFSNPDAVARWHGRIQGQMAAGRTFRLDGGPLDLPQELSLRMHDGRTAREMHNDHPRLYQQAAFAAARKVLGDDFVLLAGSGYSGSQKFAVLGGGELPSTQWGLRAAIIAVQRAAAMGFPFWGAEAGGAAGPLDREVAARWIAFSAFNAVFQPGRTATEPELAPYLRFYGALHQRLQEYSYRAAQQAHKTGLPLVRPMFLAFPRDPAAWDHWQQFLYGDDLLVGAVWQKGQASFPMYLPQGKWVDAWTGKEHTGPATVTVNTPGHKIPLFLRRGAKVSLGDLNAEWAVAQKRERSQD
jgi:alpha-D-xyloside xylohydrolase